MNDGVNPSIDFWFSIGSTYTYLSVMRTDQTAAKAGVSVNWCPFNVRHTLRKMGGYRPFADKPVKLEYMWRDIARRCQLYGLSEAQLPAPYSLDDIELPNRVALVGMAEGWGEDYVKAAYKRWFHTGAPADKNPNLTESLAAVGQDVAAVLERANSDAMRSKLLEVSEAADKIGVFGAPSFVVNGEVFWGDDRLEDAIAWAKHGTLAPQ